jgi:phenylacetate-coenzyme A ligase PaaK-like adenylate-forming protein
MAPDGPHGGVIALTITWVGVYWYRGRTTMADADFSLIDLPRTEPIDDPQAYLRAALQWHFGPDTGSPYWLGRAKVLGFDPLTDVKTFEDLALFPNIVDELRDVAVRDLVPKGYGPNPPTPAVFESGGTTGAPKRVIVLPDWEEQVTAWNAAELLDTPGLRDSGLLMVVPTGPHMFGHVQRRVAALLNSVLFTIDMDPRWVKKLVARGAADEAAAYVDHVVEQAGYILRSQDVTVLSTTPPLLQAIAGDDDLVDVINDKVAYIQLSGTHLDEDTRDILREIFPDVAVRAFGYGSTMVLASAITRQAASEEDPVIHDTRSPYVTFSVVDPATGRSVRYGERGQVVMNHVSKTMFVPNNLERDTAVRVAGPDGQVGDSVSEVKPVETFGGEAVIEGVY